MINPRYVERLPYNKTPLVLSGDVDLKVKAEVVGNVHLTGAVTSDQEAAMTPEELEALIERVSKNEDGALEELEAFLKNNNIKTRRSILSGGRQKIKFTYEGKEYSVIYCPADAGNTGSGVQSSTTPPPPEPPRSNTLGKEQATSFVTRIEDVADLDSLDEIIKELNELLGDQPCRRSSLSGGYIKVKFKDSDGQEYVARTKKPVNAPKEQGSTVDGGDNPPVTGGGEVSGEGIDWSKMDIDDEDLKSELQEIESLLRSGKAGDYDKAMEKLNILYSNGKIGNPDVNDNDVYITWGEGRNQHAYIPYINTPATSGTTGTDDVPPLSQGFNSREEFVNWCMSSNSDSLKAALEAQGWVPKNFSDLGDKIWNKAGLADQWQSYTRQGVVNYAIEHYASELTKVGGTEGPEEPAEDPEITGDFATEEDFEDYCTGSGAGTLAEQLRKENKNGYLQIIHGEVYEHFKDYWNSTTKGEILSYARDRVTPNLPPPINLPDHPTLPPNQGGRVGFRRYTEDMLMDPLR